MLSKPKYHNKASNKAHSGDSRDTKGRWFIPDVNGETFPGHLFVIPAGVSMTITLALFTHTAKAVVASTPGILVVQWATGVTTVSTGVVLTRTFLDLQQ